MTLVSEAHTDDVPADHQVFAVLDQGGDTKHMWDKNNPDEVVAARVLFDTLVGEKRMQAYSVKRNGEPGQRIREFDPEAEKIIFQPAMVGG